MKKTVIKFYNTLKNDSLYRNSLFLMLNTGIMAVLGFFFWTISTRLYSPEEVGIGTTLISTMTLISNISVLGFSKGLIRYLPKSDRKNKKINTVFILIILTSILFSIFFLIFLKTFSPTLLFVRQSIVFSILFILFVIFTSLIDASESVLIAYRSTKFILIKNTISSASKLALPLILVTLGAFGLFSAVGIAAGISLLIGLIFLIVRFKYSPRIIIDKSIIKNMGKFSLGNYIARLIGGLPVMILPLIITNLIGAKFSAYFYMDYMIASFLYIIPVATTQALFAEGSYDPEQLVLHLKKAIKIIAVIIIPAIIIISLFGNYILLAFGKTYSNEGFILLRYLVISGIFISINAICGSILYIKFKIRLLIILSFINTFIVLSAIVVFLKFNLFGVVGVGIGWIIGEGITSVIYLLYIKKFLK